jgi:hypothetical protein
MRLAGNLVQMGGVRNIYKIFSRTISMEGATRGRPRLRWRIILKRILKIKTGREIEDWVQIAPLAGTEHYISQKW